ncbi:Protein ABHD13 [Ceratocystis fimbriata CBS 114723]|uniref:Protein ABHD13 n=1 Tax=Ceratocystis fimbriata CBS 114723 TaxID=1035309 RepID=A0A2C5XGS4_9PEZI|nr:Protein ABHD13 [Ceratocystis fimbriata CBS 114723]
MPKETLDVGERGVSSLGTANRVPHVYILYLQGNAGSTPPRLPDLSAVLRDLQQTSVAARFTLVALSYRGYWKSSGRPHEAGLNLDAEAAYRWILEQHGSSTPAPSLVLWGHSIGAGIATNLAASAYTRALSWTSQPALLILEAPFLSTRAMLAALYPQKWLPYKHLWPFIRNPLDSWSNIGRLVAGFGRRAPRVAIIQAANDELVPASHPEQLRKRCAELGISVTCMSIAGAFHNEASVKPQGRRAIVGALQKMAECDQRTE